jgi:hypothetical protein
LTGRENGKGISSKNLNFECCEDAREGREGYKVYG